MRQLNPHGICPFCDRLTAGTYDASPAYNAAWFEPLNPVTPGHLLFVPDWHTEHPTPIAMEEAAGAAEEYARHVGGDYNLITSSGPAATQTVPHLHVHYVPRRPGDGLLLPWGGPR